MSLALIEHASSILILGVGMKTFYFITVNKEEKPHKKLFKFIFRALVKAMGDLHNGMNVHSSERCRQDVWKIFRFDQNLN